MNDSRRSAIQEAISTQKIQQSGIKILFFVGIWTDWQLKISEFRASPCMKQTKQQTDTTKYLYAPMSLIREYVSTKHSRRAMDYSDASLSLKIEINLSRKDTI